MWVVEWEHPHREQLEAPTESAAEHLAQQQLRRGVPRVVFYEIDDAVTTPTPASPVGGVGNHEAVDGGKEEAS